MPLEKNRTYTPKEALAADGKIAVVLGRGRMPKGGDERCKELAAKGYRIKGYAIDKSAPITADAPVQVKRVNATNEKVIQDFVIFYERDLYKAIGSDGKTYGMAEVCNNCRVSLVQNHCDNPTIYGDIAVEIVRR